MRRRNKREGKGSKEEERGWDSPSSPIHRAIPGFVTVFVAEPHLVLLLLRYPFPFFVFAGFVTVQ